MRGEGPLWKVRPSRARADACGRVSALPAPPPRAAVRGKAGAPRGLSGLCSPRGRLSAEGVGVGGAQSSRASCSESSTTCKLTVPLPTRANPPSPTSPEPGKATQPARPGTEDAGSRTCRGPAEGPTEPGEAGCALGYLGDCSSGGPGTPGAVRVPAILASEAVERGGNAGRTGCPRSGGFGAVARTALERGGGGGHRAMPGSPGPHSATEQGSLPSLRYRPGLSARAL